MDPLDMEKQAVCSALRQELERYARVLEQNTNYGRIRASQLKIQAYCNRLDAIERLGKAA